MTRWETKIIKMGISKNPVEAGAFLRSLFERGPRGYKRWEDGRLTVGLALGQQISPANSWCRVFIDQVGDLRYYYVLGEIADRPSLRESLRFDLVLSPLDPDFLNYITQCKTLGVAVFHTLQAQILEIPIVDRSILDQAHDLTTQNFPISGNEFYVLAYGSHDQLEEVKIHRPENFTI